MISSTIWSAIAVHGPVTLFVFIRILLCQNQIKERDENSSSIIIAIIYIGVQKTVLLTNLTGAQKKKQRPGTLKKDQKNKKNIRHFTILLWGKKRY